MTSPPFPLSALFDALPIGVVLLDRDGRVVHFNKTEERLARRTRERALGRDFFEEIAPCMNVRELAGVFRDRIGREPLFEKLEISFAFPFIEGPRDVAVYLRSLEIAGTPYGALFVEDVSARRASERLERSLAELLRPEAGSPIAAILAGCGLLLQSPSLDAPALHTVGDMAYSADELQGLLMSLLDISRIESHRHEVHLAPQPLGALVQSATQNLAAHAKHLGVQFEVVLSDASPPAMVDASLMTRVIDGLLLNALRNAPHGSVVQIRTGTHEEGGPELLIRDEGPPLPNAALPSVDHAYHQGDFDEHWDPAAYQKGGGLTLTFAQLACAKQGGALVIDTSEERGTSVQLTFPPIDAQTPFLRIP
ncbi:MAG: ATP-binding protein [Myxococcota bacterium]